MHRSGGSILPVFAIRSVSSEFVTFIDPPVHVPEGLP
jgi:hypothetical protein